MGKLVTRRVRRCVVLHHQPRFVRRSGTPTTNPAAYRCARGPFEPQLQVRNLGFAGRQFLVGRRHEPERHLEPRDQADRLPNWSYRGLALFQAPIAEGELQRWYVHSIRRQLPGGAGGLAVLLARLAQVQIVMTEQKYFAPQARRESTGRTFACMPVRPELSTASNST